MIKLAALLGILAFMLVYPLALIASLNYLFHFDIPYNIYSYLSVVALSSLFSMKMSFGGKG